MILAAVTEREDPRDVIIMSLANKGKILNDLKEGSVIGTSSVRRSAQLKRTFPHLKFTDIRGNLNTRLQKLDDPKSQYDAICLAYAGIHRLGWDDRISQYLGPELNILHAVGQGALGIECREGDKDTINMVKATLNHLPSQIRCFAERSFMRALEGGCSVPLGVFTYLDENETELTLTGSVTSLDGSIQLLATERTALTGSKLDDANNLGIRVADVLIKKGAKDVLNEIRNNS